MLFLRMGGLLLTVSLASVAFSQVGKIVTIHGTVRVNEQPAVIDSFVQPGDLVETDGTSKVKIWMIDKTILDVGPSSKIKIREYKDTPKERNVEIEMEYGDVRSHITQKKKDKNKFHFRTKFGVLAVRGTEVGLTVEPRQLRLIMLSGGGAFTMGNESRELLPMQMMLGQEGEGGGVSMVTEPLPLEKAIEWKNSAVIPIDDPNRSLKVSVRQSDSRGPAEEALERRIGVATAVGGAGLPSASNLVADPLNGLSNTGGQNSSSPVGTTAAGGGAAEPGSGSQDGNFVNVSVYLNG